MAYLNFKFTWGKHEKFVWQIQGIGVIFQREEKTGHESVLKSLENPNALDLAAYVYSLPFFDFLIENQIEIPINEFHIVRWLALTGQDLAK